MKALIISDNQEVINLLSSKLVDYGYDIIVYRWLLKALDNIEEIRPDYIVLSAEEYPRHWKTLASFVQSGIGGNDVKFCLYNTDSLSDDDKKKAEELGVEFYSSDKTVIETAVETVDESEEVPTVENVIEEQKTEIPVDSNLSDLIKETTESKDPEKFTLLLTHPVTQKFIVGDAVSSDENIYDCRMERSGFMIGQEIKFVSLSNDDCYKSFNADVVSFNKDLIRLKVKEYYEK